MAAVTICSDFGAQENKVCHCFHCFPTYSHEVMGPDATILVFWMVSFKPAFSLSSFTFFKRLFSSSSLSAIRVMSFVSEVIDISLAILIPACAASSPSFCMIYSACKLNKQGDNIQPWHTPFPILTLSIVSCLVLTVASWPAHSFFRFPILGEKKFINVISSCWIEFFVIILCLRLPLTTVFILKFIFSNVSISSPSFFWFPFV